MLVLAIDTATPAITAGIGTVDRAGPSVLATRVTLNARAHGELLTPHILAAAGDAGVALGELDAIVCGAGPGPYTGLRAGMVTAAALAHSLGIRAYPVCSLDAIALDTSRAQPALVVTDARRKEVYWAAYDADGARSAGPAVQRPADVVSDIPIAAGDAAVQYQDTLAKTTIEPRHPTAAGLLRAAMDDLLSEAEPAALTPMYLRKPHAQEPGVRKRVNVP